MSIAAERESRKSSAAQSLNTRRARTAFSNSLLFSLIAGIPPVRRQSGNTKKWAHLAGIGGGSR